MRSDGSRERHHVPLAGSPGTTPDGYLAPGVVHLATTDPSGPFAINVVTVDLAASSKIDVALALDVLPGQETTSSMARRRGATVAVNGDYVHPTGAPDLAALEPGDQVTVAWSFAAWPGILETSGGNPTLVRNGRVLSGNVDGTTPFHRRNPRTAVGATADGRLLIVTVDGRQPGHSVGMSLRELAELFVGLGARSAINLDGGGSTTMVIDGTIVNRISDRRSVGCRQPCWSCVPLQRSRRSRPPWPPRRRRPASGPISTPPPPTRARPGGCSGGWPRGTPG